MTAPPPRAVLDTVVFIQALISGRGPSAACFERLRSGEFILFMSDVLRAEIRGVALRAELVRKYPLLTDEKVDAFMREVEALSANIPSPPSSFILPRDPKDEPLIDLAVAGNADFLVTWNERHLTYLMKQDTPEGKEFVRRFPNLDIISPPQFLTHLNALRGS